MRFRYARALLADLIRLGVRSGRLPAIAAIGVLMLLGLLVVAATAAVPVAVYAFL